MDHSIEITVGGQRSTALLPLSDPHDPVGALYLHVPFCFHKCHYCDFYSIVDDQREDAFVDRLLEELEFQAPHAGRLETIFVGGGTPSLLGPDRWARLLARLAQLFEFGGGTAQAPATEFTVECNPETVTRELMDVLAGGGVNRVSVGAQSFDRRHLGTLERWHDPENVERALALAAGAGIQWRSVDLIFGVPGQTAQEWDADLELALQLPIDHLSCYALTYEPNTAMTVRLRKGEFEAMDEDLEAELYQQTLSKLRGAGFERYEVSNYARVDGGRQCAHNLRYWRGADWLAAGPSASAHVGGHRWKNVPNLGRWMEGVAANKGASPIMDHEARDARRALAERVMMGIRLAEGLDRERTLADAAPLGSLDAVHACIEKNRSSGMLEAHKNRLVLTDKGFMFADGIASELMDAIDE